MKSLSSQIYQINKNLLRLLGQFIIFNKNLMLVKMNKIFIFRF